MIRFGEVRGRGRRRKRWRGRGRRRRGRMAKGNRAKGKNWEKEVGGGDHKKGLRGEKGVGYSVWRVRGWERDMEQERWEIEGRRGIVGDIQWGYRSMSRKSRRE